MARPLRPASPVGGAARQPAGGAPVAVIAALLVNAVYVGGLLVYGTSATTLMLLFWLETALLIAGHHVRLSAHRPVPGEPKPERVTMTVNGKSKKVPWRVSWLWMALPFTLIHGLMVLMLALLPFEGLHDDPGWRVQWDQVGQGALLLVLFAAGGLYAGLRALPRTPFAELKTTVERDTLRVVVLQVGIIVGMFVVAWFGIATGPLLVIVALKTLVDLAVAALAGGGTGSDSRAGG
jgi:hypothetical protein